MVMITSSQASVAISSIIAPTRKVVACTTALFLSGYAIQQRTLRDLRAAIKPAPRPSPHIFYQESSDWRAALAGGEDPEKAVAAAADEQPVVIQIEQTQQQQQQQQQEEEEGDGTDEEKTADTADGQEEADAAMLLEADGKAQKPLSRVERRRRIKEEIRKLSQGESPVYYQRRLW
ncbi:hypothetical protein RB600_009687 [Gaeumannomyces tritici]